MLRVIRETGYVADRSRAGWPPGATGSWGVRLAHRSGGEEITGAYVLFDLTISL